MALPAELFDELVSLRRGGVDPRIYSDDEIFELEMERIGAFFQAARDRRLTQSVVLSRNMSNFS